PFMVLLPESEPNRCSPAPSMRIRWPPRRTFRYNGKRARETPMSALADFLQGLLSAGSVVLRQAPDSPRGADPEADALLRRAHEEHALTVAGPPIGFDARAARAAGQFAWWACWLLVNRT